MEEATAVYHRLQNARNVTKATGNHIGWAFKDSRRIQFTMDARESAHKALWRDGQNGYAWVRKLFFDPQDGYQIEEAR
jgi:hypothetical protein